MAFDDIVHDDIMLRQLEPYHARSIYELVDKSRDCLRLWLAWVDTTKDESDISTFITTSNNRYEDDGSVTAVIYWQSHICGIVSLLNRTQGTYEIGYWLSVNYQGRGIMTTAVRLIVDYAFQALSAKEIEIRVQPANMKSRAVPERLGFTVTRTDQVRGLEMVVYHMAAPL